MVLSAKILTHSLVPSLLQKSTSGAFQDFHSWEGTSPAQEGKIAYSALLIRLRIPSFIPSAFKGICGGLLCAEYCTASQGYSREQNICSPVAIILAATEMIVTLK